MAESISFTTAVRPDVAGGGHVVSPVPQSRAAKPVTPATHAPAPQAPATSPSFPPTLAQLVAQVENSGPGPEGQLLRFIRSLNPPIPPPIGSANSVKA